jgi:hypothetical protein
MKNDVNLIEYRGPVSSNLLSIRSPRIPISAGDQLSWLRFSWFYSVHVRIIAHIRPQPLLSTSSYIQYSLLVRTFDAM